MLVFKVIELENLRHIIWDSTVRTLQSCFATCNTVDTYAGTVMDRCYV